MPNELPAPVSNQDKYDVEKIRLLEQIAEGGGGSSVTLYDSTGQNTDGAMTQKAVTDALGGVRVIDGSAAKYGSFAQDTEIALGAFFTAGAASSGQVIKTVYTGGGTAFDHSALVADVLAAFDAGYVPYLKLGSDYGAVVTKSASSFVMRLVFFNNGAAADYTVVIQASSFTILGAVVVG